MDMLLTIGLMLSFIVGLAVVPFGLPGLWLMVLALVGYGFATDFAGVGVWLIVAAVGFAAVGEILDLWLGFRFAARYGGSRRAGWGAVAGGLVGALVGVPLPVLGSLVGAFLGAFAGAALLEYSAARRMGASMYAGWGAVLGRAAAAAVKVGLGLAIAVLGTYAVFVG